MTVILQQLILQALPKLIAGGHRALCRPGGIDKTVRAICSPKGLKAFQVVSVFVGGLGPYLGPKMAKKAHGWACTDNGQAQLRILLAQICTMSSAEIEAEVASRVPSEKVAMIAGSKGSKARAAVRQREVEVEPPPFPWLPTRAEFQAMKDTPPSALSDAEVDRVIDLHIQRNALGIYESLVERGDPETRDTLGRAFAIATSNLSKHGYLSEGFATRKGIQKAVEKLRDPEAWDKLVAYEKLLATFRKGPRRLRGKGRSELQRAMARQQLSASRRTPHEQTPEELAAKILRQMGRAAPKRQAAGTQTDLQRAKALAQKIKQRMSKG